MNFKTMAVATIAMTIGMASCTKESVIGNGDGIDNANPLNISIALTENVTRAVAAPIGNQVAVNFSSGYVIFTNSIGIINKITEIVSGSYPNSPSAEEEVAKIAGTKVWLEDMRTSDTGGEIRNVPAAATKVYIVGNLPDDVNAPVLSENISAVKDRVIKIATQSNDAGSVTDVTLYGDGAPLVDLPSVPNAKYAVVSVNAIASRIEIGKISYNGSTGFVTGFQLDGIFVNHYYSQMSLSGRVSTVLTNNIVVDNTTANAVYMSGSSSYADAALFNYEAGGIGYNVTPVSWQAANPDEPADNNVWAYNVLAPTSCDGINVAALAAPHIVIRLSGFATTGDTPGKVYPGTQYLTVKEFRKVGTNQVIERLAPGYIYYITNLTFNESNLTDIPEEETVTAYVEAVLMTWTRQEVEWGY